MTAQRSGHWTRAEHELFLKYLHVVEDEENIGKGSNDTTSDEGWFNQKTAIVASASVFTTIILVLLFDIFFVPHFFLVMVEMDFLGRI